MNWVDFLGYAASASVLVTFCMGTMMPLRILAIGSNVLFASFGAIAHIYPVLVLHIALLPINVVRLLQMRRLIEGVKAAHAADLSIESLLPFMTHRLLKSREILVRRDERADKMFYLIKGRMEIRELGKVLDAGAVLGEIGIFARNQRRMATVVCLTDCEVYELSESKAKQLYFQDPSFGFTVLQLIISRLLEDINLVQSASDQREVEDQKC